MPNASNSIQSVSRALSILEAVVAAEDGISLADLCRLLDLKKPTLYFLAQTLVEHGYLQKSEKPTKYHVGPACRRLQKPANGRAHDIAVTNGLQRLQQRLKHGIFIYAAPHENQLYTEYRLDSKYPAQIERRQHKLQTPYTTAANLCMLAFWEEDLREAYLNLYPFEEFGAGLWGSPEKFRQKLRSIRKAREAIIERGQGLRISVPVVAGNGELLGAFGAAEAVETPYPDRLKVREALDQAAKSLAEQILT